MWLRLNCRRAAGPSPAAAPSQCSAGLPALLRENANERGSTAAPQYLHVLLNLFIKRACHIKVIDEGRHV